MIGACFGLLTVQRLKIGRPASGKGRTTVVAAAQGIYFVPVATL